MTSIFVNCAVATPVQWRMIDGGNDHWYDAVAVDSRTNWDDAKAAAESKSYLGIKGHLATVTSQAENQFIVTTFNYPDGYWLGGSQPADNPVPDQGWQWVTGELWESSLYTAMWHSGEPCDYTGPEDALEYMGTSGLWNDLHRAVLRGGYIVEYESKTTVPEFPSVVLPVAAILGLVTIFGRRKNKV